MAKKKEEIINNTASRSDSTHPSRREGILRLKGGKVSPEHCVLVVQFRILPLEPLGLLRLGAQLRLDEGLVAPALVQHGPGLAGLVPAVDQDGGWLGAVQNRGDADDGIGFGVFVVVVVVRHHRGGVRRLAGEAGNERRTGKRDWM